MNTSNSKKAEHRLEPEAQNQRALTPLNFKLMAAAGVVIIVGFLLMLGPGSTSTEFNPDIFSARRTIIGPTLAFMGFIFMGGAIMFNKKAKR